VPANLAARHPGNVNARRHGIFSPAMREVGAQEVADELMALPHVVEADAAPPSRSAASWPS
jgi:hypothetical protein